MKSKLGTSDSLACSKPQIPQPRWETGTYANAVCRSYNAKNFHAEAQHTNSLTVFTWPDLAFCRWSGQFPSLRPINAVITYMDVYKKLACILEIRAKLYYGSAKIVWAGKSIHWILDKQIMAWIKKQRSEYLTQLTQRFGNVLIYHSLSIKAVRPKLDIPSCRQLWHWAWLKDGEEDKVGVQIRKGKRGTPSLQGSLLSAAHIQIPRTHIH